MSDLRRTLPAIALFAVLGASALEPRQQRRTGDDSEFSVQGRVENWSVAADGTIYIRIDPVESDRASVWFKTPPDKTETTRFEDLTLDIVLHVEHAEGAHGVITLAADPAPGEDGAELEKALPITSIARR
jgi:hypothetical protein